ncbi:transcription elongation regulator [Nowakowskiella sp. JEL0407]|nr:transcription elongation regulator [Nowakowskiella sp. JEL0407]
MERDPRWRQISSALQLGDIQSIFELHCHSILEKRLNLFRELVERSCSPIESFDNIWILIKDDSRVTKLLSPSQESETSEPSNGLLRRDFDRFQKERIRKANAGLEECLRENKFLQFHVRNAVQTTESAEKEGTKEAKDEDEDEEGAIAMDKVWKLINLEEIQTVLTDDKRWLEYRYFPEEREKMLKDYVTSLVESIKAEKGGTVDLTIALHAGGVINEKKHKPPKEHCDEQDSYGKRYKRDDRDRSPKRSGGSFANERRERMRYD